MNGIVNASPLGGVWDFWDCVRSRASEKCGESAYSVSEIATQECLLLAQEAGAYVIEDGLVATVIFDEGQNRIEIEVYPPDPEDESEFRTFVGPTLLEVREEVKKSKRRNSLLAGIVGLVLVGVTVGGACYLAVSNRDHADDQGDDDTGGGAQDA